MDILIFAAGLGDLKTDLMDDWLAPLFIIVVAVFSIVFLKDRAWMKLLGFVGIAAVVGMLMFGSETLFGKDGAATTLATNTASDIARDD